MCVRLSGIHRTLHLISLALRCLAGLSAVRCAIVQSFALQTVDVCAVVQLCSVANLLIKNRSPQNRVLVCPEPTFFSGRMRASERPTTSATAKGVTSATQTIAGVWVAPSRERRASKKDHKTR